MKLPQPLLKFFKTVVFIIGIPKTLSRKLHEAIDDWAEMAPYRIRMMSMSFGDFSPTGLSALKKPQGAFDPMRYRDDFTRREMLHWRFIDHDRMMFGKHDPITARQWMSLGDLYWDNRRPGDASVFYQKGLKIFRMSCENTDDRLIAAQKKMANCCLTVASYGEAEKLLNEIVAAIDAKMVLAAAERDAAGKSQPSASQSNSKTKASSKPAPNLAAELVANLLVLAESLKRRQKFRETADALNRVVDIHESGGVLPGEDCLAIYKELSETYTALGDPEKAQLFIETANQLDFMRIVESAVGAEARTLIRELEPLAALYLKRNKVDIVRGLKTRIEICELVDKVKGTNYPGIEKDLERLAVLFDERDHPGDATVSFRLRARAKRILEDATTKLSVMMMMAAGKLYWVLEAIEGMEAFIASMVSRLF